MAGSRMLSLAQCFLDTVAATEFMIERPEPRNEPVQRHLDATGVRHQTDLSSLSWDYLGAWERYLAPLRDQAFDLLHIGVGAGASLRTWREWFPASRLVGLDPRRIILDPPIANCTIVHGNQTDLGTLQPLLSDYRFRLIVDDGSHHPDDQVLTFQMLFPWLEADSVYICAGFGDRAAAPKAQPEPPGATQPGLAGNREQPDEPSAQPERLETRLVGRSNQRTGAAWFAELGGALTAGERRDCRTLEQLMQEFILRKATGVVLLRGSVVVTS